MDVPGSARFVDDHLCGHASQLEKVNFLPVQLQHAGFRIGQTGKWQIVFLPVGGERLSIFRANHNDFGPAVLEFLMVLAQLHHVPLAEWSGKAAVENEQNIRPPAKIGQSDRFAPEIFQRKIGCRGVQSNFRHFSPIDAGMIRKVENRPD